MAQIVTAQFVPIDVQFIARQTLKVDFWTHHKLCHVPDFITGQRELHVWGGRCYREQPEDGKRDGKHTIPLKQVLGWVFSIKQREIGYHKSWWRIK